MADTSLFGIALRSWKHVAIFDGVSLTSRELWEASQVATTTMAFLVALSFCIGVRESSLLDSLYTHSWTSAANLGWWMPTIGGEG